MKAKGVKHLALGIQNDGAKAKRPRISKSNNTYFQALDKMEVSLSNIKQLAMTRKKRFYQTRDVDQWHPFPNPSKRER